MITTVLFDIGNVFVTWDPRYLYEKLIPDAEELESFLRGVVTLEWHTHHDKGLPFAEGVKNLTEKYPHYADQIAAFDTRWRETIGSTIEGSVDIVEQLAARGVPMFALTNFSAEKFPEFTEEFAFTRHFGGVVVSGEEKLVKPDPAIFQIAIERFSLVPHQTLYVDDRLENVQAAEAKKMRGHHFTDPALLKAELIELGLISA